MTAEDIAAVLSDLKARKVRPALTQYHAEDRERMRLYVKTAKEALDRLSDPVVIDATAIYDAYTNDPREIQVYEDHPCVAPPWDEVAVCYRNEHGNVMVQHATFIEADGLKAWDVPDEEVDLERIRWALVVSMWVGGKGSNGQHISTTGPLHLWLHRIYDSGQLAWTQWMAVSPDYPNTNKDTATLVFLGALSYMNLRNVEVATPVRPRAQRRRLERLGVQVREILVRPVGRQSGSSGPSLGLVPLRPARGHYHHYGNCCPGVHEPKGLLFGKMEGRYWMPPRALPDREKPAYRLAKP